MPASMIPRERLLDSTVIAINEAVYTGSIIGGAVPAIDEYRGLGLWASNGVEHQTLDRDFASCGIAGILCQNGFY